jgi:DNA-binding response OmpR family regulator
MLGARDYVVKPFDPQGLRVKISQFLKSSAAL